MKRSKLLLALITPLLASAPSLLLADTLSAALARAYSSEPAAQYGARRRARG